MEERTEPKGYGELLLEEVKECVRSERFRTGFVLGMTIALLIAYSGGFP